MMRLNITVLTKASIVLKERVDFKARFMKRFIFR